jgi:hypothetical protein
LHAVLLGVDEGEDVVFGTFQDTFKDGQIRYNTAGIEVLGAVEDYLVTFRSDFQITVARVDGSSDELSRSVRCILCISLGIVRTRFCSMRTR